MCEHRDLMCEHRDLMCEHQDLMCEHRDLTCIYRFAKVLDRERLKTQGELRWVLFKCTGLDSGCFDSGCFASSSSMGRPPHEAILQSDFSQSQLLLVGARVCQLKPFLE
ncbi:MAG: hypothetical protein GY822_24125 [Deltaproteobacteria bacterium]|nr:hypothetical protein [Deltaproteobacteria bacterium]